MYNLGMFNCGSIKPKARQKYANEGLFYVRLIKNIVFLAVCLVALMLFFGIFRPLMSVKALDNNFANGITVDSTLDTADISIGNGNCDDGLGNCTLRAAIEEANSNPDVNTISFNIPGSGVKTIIPLTSLPEITQPAVIDGYSQPGASANTAEWPKPFNGTLLIDIDGSSSAVPISNGITINSNNVVVKGLAVHSFSFDGFNVNGNNNTIAGNYIGTDHTGLIDKGNSQRGVGNGPGTSYDLKIGGLSPQDRNIISGNDGPGISPNVGHKAWKVMGNYIGLAKNGLSSVPNSTYGEAGGLSLDNDDDHVIGGSLSGSGNVISGNNSFGIYPDNTKNLIIRGNIIGPNWKGELIPNNPQLGGIGFPPLAGSITEVVIGGTSKLQGNTIAFNKGTGVAVLNSTNNGSPLYSSLNVSIIGNSIYGNYEGDNYPLSKSALGIDLLNVDLPSYSITGLGPTPNDPNDVDLGPNYYMNFPVITSATQNNNQLDITFSLDAANSTINGLYRVEFFINDSQDKSGYGQGQQYLGYVNASNGVSKQASFNLAGGTNLNGKFISATTTALSNTTPSGFGSTSEFAKDLPVSVVAPSPSPTSNANKGVLANTSNSTLPIIMLLVYVLVIEVMILIREAQLMGGFRQMFGIMQLRLKDIMKLVK